MTMTLIADAAVDVDAEGFMTKPEQWNEQIAVAIAADNGIPELSDRHWLVVNFMRDRYLQTGSAPSIRSLSSTALARSKLIWARPARRRTSPARTKLCMPLTSAAVRAWAVRGPWR